MRGIQVLVQVKLGAGSIPVSGTLTVIDAMNGFRDRSFASPADNPM